MTTPSTEDPFSIAKQQLEKGVVLHTKGDFHAACEARELGLRSLLGDFKLEVNPANQAVIGAMRETPEALDLFARLERDLAASSERTHSTSYAQRMATQAFWLHQHLSEEQKTPEAAYELGATAAFLGALATKQVVVQQSGLAGSPDPSFNKLWLEVSEQEGESVLSPVVFMKIANTVFTKAHSLSGDKRPHQYEINASRRMSIAETLYGDKREGRRLAWKAIGWAWQSERQRKLPERSKAITKALLGGVAALGINGFVTFRARKTARKIAHKVL